MQSGVAMEEHQGNALVGFLVGVLFWVVIFAGVFIVRYTR